MLLVAFTLNSGDDPAVGLALGDIDLYLTSINRQTGALAVLWNGTQNPIFEVNNAGVYGRILATGDLGTYNYVGGGLYTGAALVDVEWVVGSVGRVEEPLDSIKNKDAGETYDAATDSLEAISDKLTSAQITVTSPVAGTTLTIVRGDTLTASFSGLGNIATRTKLWFTVKAQKTDLDPQAVIQILESNPGVATDGLQRLNGVVTTAAYGSILVTNAVAGNVTITLDKAATALLREQAVYYDIQVLKADGSVTTLTIGDCDVNLDVTAAIA